MYPLNLLRGITQSQETCLNHHVAEGPPAIDKLSVNADDFLDLETVIRAVMQTYATYPLKDSDSIVNVVSCV